MGPSFTGSIHEIDARISQSRLLLSTLPRGHSLRPIGVSILGIRLLARYCQSKQQDDLDKSILHLTESLLFSPLSWLPFGPMILDVLYYLSHSLSERSSASEEPEGAIYATKYLRHLRGLAHTPLIPRQQVTASLVETLELQMELKASDEAQTLEEMTALTQELLASDPSSDATTHAITCLARSTNGHIGARLLSLSLDLLGEITECLRLARMHKPDLREVHFALAQCLPFLYLYTLNDELLEEAGSIMDKLIASISPGDECLARYQRFVPRLVGVRSMADSHAENTEEAIYRARDFLSSSSVEDPLYPTWSQVLKLAANSRLENFGPIDDLKASSSSDPLFNLPSDVAQGTLLEELLDGICNNSATDIEGAIEVGRSILASSDPDLYLLLSHKFCEILFEAFKRTQNINYLNESLDILRPLLALPLPKLLRFLTISILLACLEARSEISPGHRMQDWQEMVELLPQILDKSIRLTLQFGAACEWAHFSHATQHPSASTAYETALSFIQGIVPFSPTLQLQHDTLTLSAHIQEMPLGYASYQFERGQLEQAIETLERGRALLWSEMRHLRISINQVLDADPDLGRKFASLNRDLEELTKSIPPSHKIGMDDVVADDLRAGDQFGSLFRRQRGLLKERDKLISQIRGLPGFDRFLTFPLFNTLRSAASSGPVIIVNHFKLRSDILILHDGSPSLIPTPTHFYRLAKALKDKLLNSRVKDGLDSSKYDKTLASVLAELYELVGKPVIDRLHQLQVPDQSRIWWCPTSVFCSLPLHAMGPIPSDDGERCYFLDLYICSYTPSLSALIESRNRDSGSRSSDRPSVLLVAQTDPTLPTVGGEIQVVQALDTEVTSLLSGAATPAAVLDAFQHHRFVHFACHGTLEAKKPFEAGFELHGDERLTLLQIVRADLPTAEFAFLSACHTAEVTEGSVVDESLHLAAAVQYCGFRSVVGTMWAMVDEDGRDLAENFYKALFKNSTRDRGVPYHERSAKALQFAVKKLRKKRWITHERWVNFVHYGA